MLADAHDPIARWTAGIALVVSVMAAVGTWKQAHGQLAANAPEVKVWTAHDELRIRFTSKQRIRKVVVRPKRDSVIECLGVPYGAPTKRRVVLRHVVSGEEIVLPARFAVGAVFATITITMRGRGFGTSKRDIKEPVTGGPQIYVPRYDA